MLQIDIYDEQPREWEIIYPYKKEYLFKQFLHPNQIRTTNKKAVRDRYMAFNMVRKVCR